MNAPPRSTLLPTTPPHGHLVWEHSRALLPGPSRTTPPDNVPARFVASLRRPLLRGLALAAVLGVCGLTARPAAAESLALAQNETVPTLCAEEDNVNVALLTPSNQNILSYTIEASHPGYSYTVDHSDPIWDNCTFGGGTDYPFDNPGRFSVYNDGITDVVVVREPRWWRPQGMTVIGRDGTVSNAHYIAVHRKIEGTNSYPQVLVFYQDGNLRLKPQPPAGRADTLFGTSVVVGPASVSGRPFVDVSSLQYLHDSDSFEITYSSGESAILRFDAVSRALSRVEVQVNYATGADVAFATFRSMYVAQDISDGDHMKWVDQTGTPRDDQILGFTGGLGSEFFLYRENLSIHNTSASDIRIGDFNLSIVPEPHTLWLLASGGLVGLIGSLRKRRGGLARFRS